MFVAYYKNTQTCISIGIASRTKLSLIMQGIIVLGITFGFPALYLRKNSTRNLRLAAVSRNRLPILSTALSFEKPIASWPRIGPTAHEKTYPGWQQFSM